MLDRVWNRMNDAIPRLQAEASIDLYAVAVAANADYGERDRQRIVNRWMMTISDAVERLSGAVRVSFETFDAMMRDAFRGNVRD